MPPQEFFDNVQAGVEIVPTDKSYKAYVGAHDGKFYFQHLSVDERKKFIELYNAKTMRMGYPGQFYVLPFFVKAQVTDK